VSPRRRDVGEPASGVVSLRAHASYRPDYSTLASGQVAAARQRLGLTHAEFADYLTGMLGWPVYESAVKRWETAKAPPGDALLACAAITQGIPAAALPLLAAIPPAFPAEALAGPWVTAYRFSHNASPRYHADIAHVAAVAEDRVRAVNHPPEPRSEGRATPFRNEIEAGLFGRHLIGQWRNTSDTRYYGALELAVLPGETVMQGGYYGVGSDIDVSAAPWKWVRLDPGPVPVQGITLREPAALYDVVMAHSQLDAPLALADVEGEP
jgi:DNA-binding transcriptional regulator YiaG